MSKYKINTQINSGHNRLIAFPLIIITVFCFGFVLMQPATHNRGSTSAARGSKNSPADSTAKLPTIKFAKPSSLTKLSTDSGNSSVSPNPKTSSPTKSNGSDTGRLQSASPNSDNYIVNLKRLTNSSYKKSDH